MRPIKNRYFCQDARRIKMLFETEGAAKRFIQFNAEEILEEEGKAPVRAYFCISCAGWHLTSKTAEQHRYKSRIERYFERKDIISDKDCNKLLAETLEELTNAIIEFITAKNDLEKSKATLAYNLVAEKFRKYMKDPMGANKFKQWRTPLLKLGWFISQPYQSLKEIFEDISKENKDYQNCRTILNKIEKGVKLKQQFTNSLK